WDGEHVGKWLHAATLAWVYTGDPALKEKLDYIASELIKCQLPDGYLGTYLDKDRWTEWDVWAHKYNLIGLITYMHYTGNLAPLPACRRMGDLLCNTFGDEPGKRDILKAGWHVGMAPTSVLEPMVLLYRLTGEPRYLEFCRYILRAWEHPDGPKIISTLLTLKRVDKVGNGKAYEMLSCLNGALEYYRTVNDPRILQACLNAWDDIVKNRLYITGAASYGELFHGDYDLPNVDNVGETCVTVTWLQFNAQLLRLTGEARFADQLERVVLNQLFGAQRCDGSGWGYYVQMEGKKPYSSTLDGHCCLSSGPRGVALIPSFAISTDADGVVVNLYDQAKAEVRLRDQSPVTVQIQTLYPHDGRIGIAISPAQAGVFAVKLRIPAWCHTASARVNGRTWILSRTGNGYAVLSREWHSGDRIDLSLKLEPRIVVGDHLNNGKVAILYGPLVLAADQALLGNDPDDQNTRAIPLSAVAAAGTDLGSLKLRPEPAPHSVSTWPGAQVFRINAIARKTTRSMKRGSRFHAELIPFADAGESGSLYKVWLPLPKASTSANLFADGQESRSRQGNLSGSITDEDFQTAVVTFNNQPATEDWFAVTLDEPVS
ncbi:MAG TPA: beta-L-arabinofuranosidase domain-containing protein, partial [Verrucomicrobiae bacterium]|nr:beta-L-arabinofuranosidase domain-containing protein [Verrucomicrobiae bacterium]